MGLVKLSSELALVSNIELENMFILEYMPYAPESYSKVYIYGKMLASSGNEYDNNALRIAKLLGMTEDEVVAAFTYWQEKGIVSLASTDPLEIEYLPVRSSRPSARKFSKTKYTPFNEQLMRMFPHRDFTPSEYNEYYSVIEDYHIDINAMLFIFSYCARLKGDNVGWRYVVTVARNLAKEGCRTAKEVEDALGGMSVYDDSIKGIFKELKVRRKPDVEDKQLYHVWTKEYGFEQNALLRLAKEVYSGEMRGMDAVVKRYYLQGIVTFDAIDKYLSHHEQLIALTKELLIKLDVRFTRLDHYAETYVSGWLKKGFSGEALRILADYCFRHERKSCESMNTIVEKFEALGLFGEDDIKDHFAAKVKHDDEIKSLLSIAGSDRRVSSRDRELFAQWRDWNISDALMKLAAEKAKGLDNPLAYMNKLIVSWEENNIKTPEEAAKISKKIEKSNQKVVVRKSAEEINAELMTIRPEDI